MYSNKSQNRIILYIKLYMFNLSRKTQCGQTTHEEDRRPGKGCGSPIDTSSPRPVVVAGNLWGRPVSDDDTLYKTILFTVLPNKVFSLFTKRNKTQFHLRGHSV